VDVAGFFKTLNLADLVIFVYLFGWFVLGWAQGAVRRLVGILTVSFSFFLAAQLNVYLGPFLTSHWTQFPAHYADMIGFGTLFIAGAIAFALVVQGTYKRVAIFAEHPIIDEVLGGILGLVQGGLVLMYVMIILGTFFETASPAADPTELPILRPLWEGIHSSWTGGQLDATIIPAFLALTGFLIPSSVRAVYGK
jgi:uncharacterized membrane protein required for colicin V production